MKTPTMDFQDSDRSFKRIAAVCVLVYTALALVMNIIPIRAPERQDFTQLPPRIARLIVEAAKPLPPPPTPPKPTEEKAQKKEEPQPSKPEEPSVKTPPPTPPEAVKPQGPTPEEIQAQQEALRKKNMEVAMNSGLLKLLKQPETKNKPENAQDAKLNKVFSEVKQLGHAPEAAPGTALQTSPPPAAGIDDIVAKLEKSIKASKPADGNSALAGSGGINQMIGNLQTDPGSSSLRERKTSAVKSPFQIKGFEEGKSPRSYESIAQAVDSYKGGISFLYNKALRENPTLRGTITLEFIIAASGNVADCRVVSSSMSNASFEEALVKRVLQWKFLPIASGDVTILYPIVFSVAG